MSQLKASISRYFEDSFEWFDRSYIADWLIVGILWFLTTAVKASPVYERGFDINDPTISYPQREDQVSAFFNNMTALFVPSIVVSVIGFMQRSLMVIHHGAIGICATRGLTELTTEMLKHSVGRLRPDFLSRCAWDKVLGQCTGHLSLIINGRKSFPSGHSSTAFSGMVFLSLTIAGQTAAWCFSIPKTPRKVRSSRMLTFFLALLPLFWATHVAVTRLQDHRHHKEDVIVGSFIGIVCAVLCYLIFWPNPFSLASFHYEVFGKPRWIYKETGYVSTRATDFDLEGVAH
ncbi:lipid phosphate phosphatase 1 [Pholiota conissans]|uniref:Lipid phosphate phosphatase 1 n=1 Tax=Pholiota conissans TaxID=109636 RepID=A0A9P5YZY1_9AGAR|nr:lipid phosphate phosphatase 1 [Pholiota conissans]